MLSAPYFTLKGERSKGFSETKRFPYQLYLYGKILFMANKMCNSRQVMLINTPASRFEATECVIRMEIRCGTFEWPARTLPVDLKAEWFPPWAYQLVK